MKVINTINSKAPLTLTLLVIALLISGCSDTIYSESSYEDRIQELEQENEDLQDRNSSLEDSVENANDQIRDAQSNAWEDYDTMGDTLDNLSEAD